ncbi:MAG: PHB depolymerase family esterase [Microthrixaceae bacterium]
MTDQPGPIEPTSAVSGRGALVVLLAVVGLAAGGCASTENASGSREAGTSLAGPAAAASGLWESEVAPVPSPGCGSAATPSDAGVTDETLAHNGVDRDFTVFVPERDGGSPMPLLLDLHGLGSNKEQQRGLSGYEELARRDGVAVAWPQGLGERPGWDFGPNGANDDVGFMVELVAAIGESACIDEARVYASGMSNGGLLSSALACLHPETFAAVAPVAGYQVTADCGSPSSVILFYGTDDAVLPWAGGVGEGLGAVVKGEIPDLPPPEPPDMSADPGFLAPVPVNVNEWATLAGCDPERTEDAVSTEVAHWVYDDCDDGAVEAYVVDGGGHSWPGSEALADLSDPVISAVVGTTTFDISATDLAWAFFAAHPRR